MNLRAAVGHADLLRLMAAFGGDVPSSVLTMCRFGKEETRPDLTGWDDAGKEDKGTERPGQKEPERPVQPLPMPEADVRHGQRRLTYVRAETLEPLAAPTQGWSKGDPLPVNDLLVDWGKTGPEAPPLMPWRKMGLGLRHRLGRWRPGHRMDGRVLERRWGLGLPVRDLPRLERMTWVPDLVVLVDGTSEVGLFGGDAEWVLERLRQERGSLGLHVRAISEIPFKPEDLRLPPQAPVLVISAMGQLSRSSGVMAEWRRLGRRWLGEGRTLLVLNPAPARRWDRRVTSIWPTVCWDVRGRVPRQGRLPVGGGWTKAEAEAALVARETLLDLLAPAVRIRPELMRRARLMMGPKADAGLEHDAWHAPGTWRGRRCMGLEHGEAHGLRMQRRVKHLLALGVGSIVAEHHQDCSLGLQMEAELRALLAGPLPASAEKAEAVTRFFGKIRDRLRLMAKQRADAPGWRRGMSAWILQMTERLPPDLRRDQRIRECLSEAWAWAQALAEQEHGPKDTLRAPEGLDPDIVERVLKEAAIPRDPSPWRLLRRGPLWWVEPRAADNPTKPGMVPMGDMMVGEPRVWMDVRVRPRWEDLDITWDAWADRWGDARSDRFVRRMNEDSRVIEIGPVDRTADVRVASELERLTFSPLRRPGWARSMAQDRFGLRATFEVRGVMFALRWIPPGSFWMGSPEDEPGRFDDEGPRHRVSITHGFWMGETPVTQEQWRAVVEEAGPRLSGLKPEPSYFKPRPDLPRPDRYSAQAGLPVELVSWDDCLWFSQLLSKFGGAADGERLDFRLPTEAEWEHACRAGTDTALYTGPIDIQDSKASALDDIAWYVHNSGPDVDVANPQDPREWQSKDFPIQQAGTRRVGMKRPNGWGLHDMIGNVWEWCWDGRRAYPEEAMRDPGMDFPETSDASRVVRGGSWHARVWRCRSAYRYGWPRVYRRYDLGFRLLAGQKLLGGAEPLAAVPPPAERGRAGGASR